jgi:Patched family
MGAYFRRLSEEMQLNKHQKQHTPGRLSTMRLLQDNDEDDDDSDSGDSVKGVEPERSSASNNHISASDFEKLWDQGVVVDRIRSTLDEVGLSITMTTVTTTAAFILGCISSIPGIRWLCLCESLHSPCSSLLCVLADTHCIRSLLLRCECHDCH